MPNEITSGTKINDIQIEALVACANRTIWGTQFASEIDDNKVIKATTINNTLKPNFQEKSGYNLVNLNVTAGTAISYTTYNNLLKTVTGGNKPYLCTEPTGQRLLTLSGAYD